MFYVLYKTYSIMFENCRPFDIQFIQKASPNTGDAFDFALIYKFFTDRTELSQSLKYILRVEVFDDLYAVKFYAARDRKLDNKYNRLLKVHTYRSAIRLFFTCASLVSSLHVENPSVSFVINGAESHDLISGKQESIESNQRFRIYRSVALKLFGSDTFVHYQCPEASSYMLININKNSDTDEKFEEIKRMFIDRGFEI